MRKMILIAAAAVAALTSGTANAAKTFDVNGSFLGGGTLTGSFTTNDAVTSVTALRLISTTNVVGPFTFQATTYTDANAAVVSVLPIFSQITISGATTQQLLLVFSPTLTSSGASLGAGSYEFQTNAGTRLLSGTVTAQVAAVPEPATWAMMLTGLGLVAGVSRYRRRKTMVTYA